MQQQSREIILTKQQKGTEGKSQLISHTNMPPADSRDKRSEHPSFTLTRPNIPERRSLDLHR